MNAPSVSARGRVTARLRRGFGLLEVIVALAILGTSGVTLFAWIHQNLEAATRVRDAERSARLTQTASAWIATLNPMLQPAGADRVAGLEVDWTSQLIEPARHNASFVTGSPGTWEMGLYRVTVRAVDVKSGARVEIEQWQVGYRRLDTVPAQATQ